METITDADYTHTKNVSKDFQIKNLREYHELYVQGNTLFLADVFVNFQSARLLQQSHTRAHHQVPQGAPQLTTHC